MLPGLFILPLPAPADDREYPDLRHSFHRANGVRLHAVASGHGRAPLVLFLHGFPEFWYAWKGQLAAFSRDHLAVALDMRGYNLSDRPPEVERYALPELVRDVKELADDLDPDRKVVLVGHDWGGVVAWAVAAEHPDRLRRLVIVNAPHPALFARELAENPEQRRASAYMELFRSPQAEAVLSAQDFQALSAGVFGGAARPDAFSEEDRAAYRRAWSRPGALTGGLNYYRAARLGPGATAAPALPPSLSTPIRVPTLVIWGERDTALLTSNLNGLEQLVPNLTIHRVPDGTHWLVHEQPELVNARIRAFLN